MPQGEGDILGVCHPIGLNGVFVEQKCIRLVREKLIIVRTDSTSLECTFHWLSKNAVKFEVDVGVCDKFAKI